MDPSQALLEKLRKILGAYAKNGKPESLVALADLLVEIQRTDALKRLGCQEKECRICSWGKEDAQEWRNQCRLWAFAEVVEDSAYSGRRGNAAVQKEARELHEVLKASPLPAKKK